MLEWTGSSSCLPLFAAQTTQTAFAGSLAAFFTVGFVAAGFFAVGLSAASETAGAARVSTVTAVSSAA